ncbi:MAG TPA: ATP-binding protein, partial [Candidatus Polarisedimenticolia bacterium]|nr:ATP-binding protein [Candidatus Polarisedimenticolia bacterium]
WGASRGLHRFLDQVVLDARVDLTRIEWDATLLPRLALQGGIFLAVAAAGIVVAALVELALTGGGARHGRPTTHAGLPPALRAVIFTLAVTGLYVPLLQHAYGRLRRDFFEHDLMQRILYQSVGRGTELRDSLRMTDEGWFEAAAGYDDDRESPGSLAYRLWSRTPLASMGLSSSLRLFDEEGREVSRFAVNLGIMFEPRFGEAREAAGADPIALPPREGVTLRKAVLFGSRWIETIGSPRRLLVLTVIDDYDNVPLVGAESAYLPLLRSHALTRTNPELLRFEPFIAVFGPGLERLYESGGEIPAPSPAIVGRLERAPFVWSDEVVGEGPARILYFKGRGETFAVAHLRRDLVGFLAAWLRLSIANGMVLLVALGVARAVGGLGGAHLPPLVPAGSFYARLTTVFLITALAPLLSLAWFATRYSARESERNLVASGLASLQTVRRVAEDYLNLPDPGYGRNLDNEVVFWLSRVVRQDINLYRGSDLVATSTPELYGSALLNRRLDGGVYQALYLDREPFRLARARVAGLDYRTLSAPMRLDPQGTIGVVSIPLAAQSRAVARRAEELGDAILISSCLTVALLALVGWIVARRVSGPIASLAGASRRVASGDLSVRVPAHSHDEIGMLIGTFNSMAESLQQQRQDLSRRSEYIETILARATTGVLSLDARGAVITINPAAQQLLARGERLPQPGDDLALHLEDAPRLLPFVEALERSLDGRLEGEVSLRLGTGDEDRRLRAVFLPFAHGGDALPGRIVIVEDVTDIVRSGRLAAWSEMARRIAHEVKNPLTPIQLSVEHVRRLWRANDARFGTVLQECLDNIQSQVRALRQIATEFSAYARLPRLKPEVTSVETLLTEALAPYAAAAPQGVTLARSVEPSLPPLYVDRAVIGRVLVNLVENALQAMPHGGRLEVDASLRPHPPARPGARVEGRSVRIVVRDTGTGIDPDILARIYEPYFSTKTGGTGLGLAIARNAVEEHGGTIEIESRPGAGTTVTVDLPVPASGANALAAG